MIFVEGLDNETKIQALSALHQDLNLSYNK